MKWRKLHNEELNNLYYSPNIVRVIKSKLRWVVHVACMGKLEMHMKCLLVKLNGKDPFEKLGIDYIHIKKKS
jgi:hypothetical protein